MFPLCVAHHTSHKVLLLVMGLLPVYIGRFWRLHRPFTLRRIREDAQVSPGISVPLTPSLGIHHAPFLGKAATKSLECFSGSHSVSPLQKDRTENTFILSHKAAKMRGQVKSPHFAALSHDNKMGKLELECLLVVRPLFARS